MLEWIVFKPRGPESGGREVERESQVVVVHYSTRMIMNY